MLQPPDSISSLVLAGVVGAWALALVSAWLLRRWFSNRHDRLGEASSEEILGELKSEYNPVHHVVIRTQTEYLPFVFECIRENVDGGFEDKQVFSLLNRIELHGPFKERAALFPVDVNGTTSELRFKWTRDSSDRIEIRVEAVGRVIRALRRHKKTIPRAVMVK